jgi:hypothetical protein
VKAGGKLVLTHDIPVLDENMLPCSVLMDGLFLGVRPKDGSYKVGAGVVIYQDHNLFGEDCDSDQVLAILKPLNSELTELMSDAQVWVHRHPNKDIAYYFVLGLDEQEKTYRISDGKYEIEVDLPKKSSAIVRMEEGKMSAGVVKGIHEFEESYVAPAIRNGNETLIATHPCDLFFTIDDDGEMDCEVATEQESDVKVSYNIG